MTTEELAKAWSRADIGHLRERVRRFTICLKWTTGENKEARALMIKRYRKAIKVMKGEEP